MKAIVLSSGGVDSTTCVAIAVEKYGADNVITATASYGQKHLKEAYCAVDVAKHYGIENYILDLHQIMKHSNCPLLSHSTKQIKHKSYAEQIAEDGEGMVDTYVPFRNGVFLSAVAALAVSLFPKESVDVYLGAHADDAAGNAYADCSQDFVEAMGNAIKIGTYGKVQLVAPLVGLTKAEVVAWGLRLHTPYELTWSCYEGGSTPCGTCATCIDRANAFRANGVEDPAVRKNQP